MRPLVTLLMLASIPASAGAQPITFDEAIALSLETPRLRGAERELEVRRDGDRDIAGTSQGISIEATPGVRILSEEDRGFDGQLAITHSWNLGDLTGARRRAAEAERRVIAAERRALALEARLEAARRWFDLWRLGALIELIAETEALARQLAEVTERAVAAGVQTSVDQAEVEAYAAEVQLRAIALQGALHDAAIALSVAMGRPPSAGLRAAGVPPAPQLPAELDADLVERLPSVAIERLAAAAERAREAELAAAYAPVLALGAQVERESPSGVIARGVIGLSFPLFDHGQRERSVARGQAARREGEAEAARLRAAETLSLALHDVDHQRRELEAASERLVPALERLAERQQAALRAGEGTIFQLLSARRRQLEARAREIEARAARSWAELRLWVFLAELERAGGEE